MLLRFSRRTGFQAINWIQTKVCSIDRKSSVDIFIYFQNFASSNISGSHEESQICSEWCQAVVGMQPGLSREHRYPRKWSESMYLLDKKNMYIFEFQKKVAKLEGSQIQDFDKIRSSSADNQLGRRYK